MSGIGFGSPGRMIEARLPREPADFRIGHVVVNVRELLGERVLRPHTLRSAEIRNARLRRDAGACQCHNPGGCGQPGADQRNVGHSFHQGATEKGTVAIALSHMIARRPPLSDMSMNDHVI